MEERCGGKEELEGLEAEEKVEENESRKNTKSGTSMRRESQGEDDDGPRGINKG